MTQHVVVILGSSIALMFLAVLYLRPEQQEIAIPTRAYTVERRDSDSDFLSPELSFHIAASPDSVIDF